MLSIFLLLILLRSNIVHINCLLLPLQQRKGNRIQAHRRECFGSRDQMREWSAILHAALESVFQVSTSYCHCHCEMYQRKLNEISQSSVWLHSSLIMLQLPSSFLLHMCLSCKCQYKNITARTVLLKC